MEDCLADLPTLSTGKDHPALEPRCVEDCLADFPTLGTGKDHPRASTCGELLLDQVVEPQCVEDLLADLCTLSAVMQYKINPRLCNHYYSR